MTSVNGFAAILGRYDTTAILKKALESISHRAQKGYCIQLDEARCGCNAEDIETSPSSMSAGGCLRSDAPVESDFMLHGAIYDPADFNFKSRVVDEVRLGNYAHAASSLADADAAYCFVFFSEGKMIYGRDPLGLKPLYRASSGHHAGIASEMKALRSAGFGEIQPVTPGYLYCEGLESRSVFPIRPLSLKEPSDAGMEDASETVMRLITKSVEHRLSGVERIAVGFSGGLDSSLLAKISSRFTDVTLVTVCTENSPDRLQATSAAEKLHLHHIIELVDTEKVRAKLAEVKRIVESERLLDISLGLAINTLAQVASSLECSAIELGQLADELFGGYHRYLTILRSRGEGEVHRAMGSDVLDMWRNNFERDEKASSPYLDATLPYASLELVEYSLSIPVELKINRDSGERKVILRRVAEKEGVPEEITSAPKKALQYSSGIQKVVNQVLHAAK